MRGEQAPAVDPLWEVWRGLVAQFSMRRLLANIAFTRAAWGIYGVDVISSLKATKPGQAALGILADVSEQTLTRLVDLAALNARRSEAMWRLAALFYVTVPVTLFLASLEGAPDVVGRMMRDIGGVLAALVAFLTIWLLYYFANNWRARQIDAIVDLARIERAGRS